MSPKAHYFESPADFRIWLRTHHKKESELLVGYYKKHTGTPSLTWPESVEEALCYGWIDGIRRRVDDDRYTIRFTPRNPKSNWSAVNVKLMAKLERSKRMTKAGRDIFEARKDPDSKGYTYEKMDGALDAPRERVFKKDKTAWRYFSEQPPGYRKKMIWWVMSAKRDDTRDRRLKQLIESSYDCKRLM